MKKLLSLFLFAVTFSLYGQETLNLIIEDKGGQPLPSAVVHFVGKHFVSDSNGKVSIPKLSQGKYPIKVNYLGFLDYEAIITIPAPNPYRVTMQEEVNQLAGTTLIGHVAKPVTATVAIDKPKLQQKSGEELAKVLTMVTGVSMIQTGATIAKPVIHGLHSNRILILNNEVRQEGQQWGADHAPEIDPAVADRIAVVKGADAVRYGSDALGGVVVITPNKLPYGDGLHGQISPSFASNGRKTATTLKLESGVPHLHHWAWRLQGTLKRSGDIHTADYMLNNTAAAEANFSAAIGMQQETGAAELFYSRYENESSVFYGSHIGNLDDLLARFEIGRPLTTYPFSYSIQAPKQKVVHHLLKAKAYYFLPFGGKLTAQYAFQKDIRQEFSVRRLDRTRIPALNMWLTTHLAEVFWENMDAPHWKTLLGGSFSLQDNYNQPGTGVVPVIPNFASVSYGAFAIEKYHKDNWNAEAGLRYDYKYLSADGYDMYSQRYGGEHNFHNITYSLGGAWQATPHSSLSSNIGVAWRTPQVNELYSSGLHHGAGTYNLGEASLSPETGAKWITSLSYNHPDKGVRLTADAYVQLIKNYIYDYPTGEVRTLFSGVYPIFQYTQADAFFRGVDIDALVRLAKRETLTQSLSYGLRGSVVFANELKTHRYFPFIPAPRLSQSLEWKSQPKGLFQSLEASIGHTFVAKQTRFEPSQELVATTPDAYHLFEAAIGGTIAIGEQQTLSVRLSAENLFNQLYKEYTNRFRYYAHDLGRNVYLRLNYNF
ncbi:TonB-dependent receptor domain-containing protein [Capnocytophaga gingivalis]|uniref:TonB-dependent receptor n=1 Tax=Capnocytophaga gingivalis TaxID=1017 RepID=A0ABU5Z788_9FLAO|nr:TonB-dependent receptor [Capnocytophaga gingivalis]MEB3074258.1 TonB-dependent receptor [Capnocytophaga gingivalis]